MPEESPFIEEKDKTDTETKPVDVDALMNTLDQFEIDSPEKLQGKMQNAQDFANMQSERDQYANEAARLRQEASARPAPATDPIDTFQEGQSVDIENLVAKSAAKAVGDALDARDQRAFANQKRMNDTWVKITGHKRFPLVKEEWEEALRDPSTVMRLQTGQVDAVQFFNDMVIEKVVGVARQASSAFKQMKGSGELSPPHIEGQARVPQSNQEKLTAKDKKINELREKAAKPGGLRDEDQDSLIDAALGDLFK